MNIATTTAGLSLAPQIKGATGAGASSRQSPGSNALWQHYSLLVYAVPAERVRSLVPEGFAIEEFYPADPPADARGGCALLSIESFLDSGSGFLPRQSGSFEQTKYRIHVLRHGQPGVWMLGTLVGSLTAVAPRHLWSLPWHLSAMEFQVARSAAEGRYLDYRLQSYSQWTNAAWELRDTGLPLDPSLPCGQLSDRLHNSLRNSAEWFERRDGQLSEYRTTRAQLQFTQAQVLDARCDLLERHGLMTRAELRRPLLAALQPRLSAHIQAPVAEEKEILPRNPGPTQLLPYPAAA